jgi:hypothetical protein
MVHDKVKNDMHAALMRFVDQFLYIVDGSVIFIDNCIAADIIAPIFLRALEEGRNPQSLHAKRLQFVEFLDDSAQVTYPVAVAVLEGAG